MATTPAQESAGPVPVVVTGPAARPTPATFTYVRAHDHRRRPRPRPAGRRHPGRSSPAPAWPRRGGHLRRPGRHRPGAQRRRHERDRDGAGRAAAGPGRRRRPASPARMPPPPTPTPTSTTAPARRSPASTPTTDPTSGGTEVTADRLGPGRGHRGALRRQPPAPTSTVNPEGTRLTVTTPAGPVGAAPVTVTSPPRAPRSGPPGPSPTSRPAGGRGGRSSPRAHAAPDCWPRPGVPLLAVALVGTALATVGHLLRAGPDRSTSGGR